MKVCFKCYYYMYILIGIFDALACMYNVYCMYLMLFLFILVSQAFTWKIKNFRFFHIHRQDRITAFKKYKGVI